MTSDWDDLYGYPIVLDYDAVADAPALFAEITRAMALKSAMCELSGYDEKAAEFPLPVRRGVHRSVQALEKDIRNWIAAWNTDPKPYVWTKSADEILEGLAGYLNRIPDSEHWMIDSKGCVRA